MFGTTQGSKPATRSTSTGGRPCSRDSTRSAGRSNWSRRSWSSSGVGFDCTTSWNADVVHVAILPGDGIGPEVTAEAERVLAAAAERFGIHIVTSHHPIGAAGVQDKGDPLPRETRDAVARADAVLLGAVGDPSLDSAPRHLKPETGLLALRALLGVYANLRPVVVHPRSEERRVRKECRS